MVFKRRNKRRRRRRGKRRLNIRGFGSKSLLGNKLPLKFKYQTSGTLNPGVAGISAVQIMSANGLWDPDITGVGHQPRGFDQIMLLYNHYTVVSSKIKINFAFGSSTSHSPLVVGCALWDNTTTSSDINEYMESRNVSYKTASPGAPSTTIVKTFSARKFLGRPHPLSEDDLRGNITGNPSEQGYYHVFVAPTNAVDANEISYNLVIEYNAVMTEPNNPSQS